MENQLKLLSPLSGLIVPLTDVPDPVFSGGVMGKGIAIDPTDGKVASPCDGKVLNIHPSRHALTIELENGTQVLIHIGIDTVKLRGEGFTAKVKSGDKVKSGQLLIEFDLDKVAMSATSLISPVILIEPKNAQLKLTSAIQVGAGKDELFTTSTSVKKSETASQKNSDSISSRPLRITDPTGLHARPAAVIANIASQFESQIEIEFNGRKANAKGLIGIMGLEIPGHSEIRFHASGKDAHKAISSLEKSMSDPLPERAVSSQTIFKGVVGSKGLASGKISFLKRTTTTENRSSDGKSAFTRLEDAILQAKDELHLVEESMRSSVGAPEAAIFAAHRSLLQDPEFIEAAFAEVKSGKSAEEAWQTTVTRFSAKLKSLKNELFASRASDLEDVGHRVLAKLSGTSEVNFHHLKEDTILIAEDLGPGDLANIRGTKIVGICTTGGGATSHVAIIARALGLPALHGVGEDILNIPESEMALLDASNGELKLAPSPSELQKVKESIVSANLRSKQELQECSLPVRTRDGHNVQVAANLATLPEAVQATELTAEGVGLLRSELYFSEKLVEPTEDEQFEFYREVAKRFKDKPVVIRTLDVGGDKPLSYLPMKQEANPFLGERGIRFTLANEKVFRRQIRAIVRAGEFGNVHVMFPMITTLTELKEANRILEEETANLKAKKIPMGIMVEVPTAALIADQLATFVDFFSIGTNDLTQYTLAMDRTNPHLSKQVDGLHPGVLKLIHMTVEAAHKHGKWVGVCGGLAAEPEAIPFLLGLGVDELSVSVPAIPAVKAAIRKLDLSDCKTKAAKCLTVADASEVRALL